MSKQFPFSIAGIPWAFEPSDSRDLGAAIVLVGLPIIVENFGRLANEANRFGSIGDFDEDAQDRLAEDIRLAIQDELEQR